MSWKRSMMEGLVWCAARAAASGRSRPEHPGSIFVLRNNDLGDLLIITPLFEALRKRFPTARIAVGVGDWHQPVLERNPHLSEVLPINAPWHNKFVRPQGLFAALKYIGTSSESRVVARRRFEVGIDVLGSPFGSLLLLRCGIPWRMGVKGYAGGHSATRQSVLYDETEHVGRSALQFAEMLGAGELPESRPQIFLSPAEEAHAESTWRSLSCSSCGRGARMVIGPGGGFPEKCWPQENWMELVRSLATKTDSTMAVLGGKQDAASGERLAAAGGRVRNLAGRLGLRESFALVAKSDCVICNSSMLMHVAAAFSKPAVVLLGAIYPSATAHARQWGHAGSSVVLGREPQHPHIFSPADAFTVVQAQQAQRRVAA